MRNVMLGLGGLLVALATTGAAQAAFIFDNGAYSGSQVGRFNSSVFTIYEDFSLAASTTVTGLAWSQHDQSLTYSNTTLTVFNALPSAISQIFSANIVATRTANGTGVLFGNYSGFDYEIAGLSLTLSPGTYYFGLTNNVSGGSTTWDETTGTAQTIPGRFQSNTPPSPGNFFASEDSVFQIATADVTPAPVPPTLFMVVGSMGVFGLRGLLRLRSRAFPTSA